MKTAFFLVLLANLTLLMYEYHRGAFGRAPDHAAPNPALLREPIVLASEYGSQPLAAAQGPGKGIAQQAGSAGDGIENPSAEISAAALPTAKALPEVTPSTAASSATASVACYQAGPFPDEKTYTAWSKQISDRQGTMKPMPPDAQDIIDYLVLYPVAGGPDDAKAALQMLRDKGIRDAYRLATGDHKGHISLGAFRREARAVLMQKDLRGKAIETVVKPLFKNTRRKFALITGSGAISDQLDALAKGYPDIQVMPLSNADSGCSLQHSGPSGGDMSGATAESRATQAPGSQGPVLPEIKPDDIPKKKTAAPTANAAVIEKSPGLRKQNQGGATGASAAKDPLKAKFVCYEAGPFPNEHSMSAWRREIAAARGAMKPISREGKEISDYLVLYPSASPEETRSHLQMLRDHGINDAWPLSSGDEKGQISLGVFNREENALQMQKSLLDRGINSVVRPRYKNKRQRYALISGAESIADAVNALRKSNPAINLKPVSNPERGCSHEISVKH
ncbi:MAG: hypothetical protein ACU83V_00045 [Gammaproteobacteria bacterium]